MKRGSTWTYVLYLGRDASGKKQQKWVGGHRTKKEAEEASVEALERMRTGMWVDPGTTTFGEFLTEWLAGPGCDPAELVEQHRLVDAPQVGEQDRILSSTGYEHRRSV